MKTVDPRPAGLNCRGSTRLVSEARDRPLTDAEAQGLATHIRDCPQCQVASRQFADLFALLEQVFARGAAPRPGAHS